jgi:hypothetical protein
MGVGGIYEPTRDELSIKINTLLRDVERLDNELYLKRSSLNQLTEKIDNVKEYILDTYLISDKSLSEELYNVAEILDIGLTKRYAVDITVTYRGEVEIAIGQDIEDLKNQISFDFNVSNGDGWEIEIEQDNVKVDHEGRWWL